MRPTAGPLGFPDLRRVKRSPQKRNALFKFRHALQLEKYEACADLIQTARDLGAQDFEIQDLLEDPRRIPVG